MARLIRCECGFVARGDTDDQMINNIRAHMKEDHPASSKPSRPTSCAAGSNSNSARRTP